MMYHNEFDVILKDERIAILMGNFKIKAIAEGAVFAALCTVLSLIGIYVPFLSFAASLVCGIPVMFMFCKWGTMAGVCSLVCALGVTMILTGNVVVVAIMSLMYIIPAAMFGFASYKNMKFSVSVMLSAIPVFLGVAAELILLNGDGTGINAQFNAVADEIGKNFTNIASQLQVAEGMNVEKLISDAISLTVYIMKLYLPSFALIFSVVIGYIISVISIFFAKRLRIKNIEYVPFNMIKAPVGTMVVYIVTFLIAQFNDDGGIVVSAVKNLHLITTAIIALSGFSFADYILSKKISKGYIRTLIYAGVFVFGFVMISLIFEMFVLLGIFDSISKNRVADRIGDDDGEQK